MIIMQHITEIELLKISLLNVSGTFLNKITGMMEDKVLTIIILRYTFFKKGFVGSFIIFRSIYSLAPKHIWVKMIATIIMISGKNPKCSKQYDMGKFNS